MRSVRLDAAEVAGWLAAETPGPDAILGHVVTTGHGRARADRWPRPAAILVETGGNYLLAGAPEAVDPAALRPLVRGFLAAPASFEKVLDAAFPGRIRWDRVVYRFTGVPSPVAKSPGASRVVVRRLGAEDTGAVARLSAEVDWISKTWGGPAGLAASGLAYGAFHGDRLAAVTGTFFAGARHEDAGVVTEPELRGHGLATACASAWCADVVGRGKLPSWTTSPDNTASRRIPERLGFTLVRYDTLHVIGVPIPT